MLKKLLHGFQLRLGSDPWPRKFTCRTAAKKENKKPNKISHPDSAENHLFIFDFYLLSFFFRVAPMAYESSQARDRITAATTGLCHSHSNARSKPRLQPTPQLMAMPDPQPTGRDQGLNLSPHRHESGSLPLSHNGKSLLRTILHAHTSWVHTGPS